MRVPANMKVAKRVPDLVPASTSGWPRTALPPGSMTVRSVEMQRPATSRLRRLVGVRPPCPAPPSRPASATPPRATSTAPSVPRKVWRRASGGVAPRRETLTTEQDGREETLTHLQECTESSLHRLQQQVTRNLPTVSWFSRERRTPVRLSWVRHASAAHHAQERRLQLLFAPSHDKPNVFPHSFPDLPIVSGFI